MTWCVSPGNTQMTFGGSSRSSACSERFASLHPAPANHLRISASRSPFLVENDFRWPSTTSRVCKRKWIACGETQTAHAMQAISVPPRWRRNLAGRVLPSHSIAPSEAPPIGPTHLEPYNHHAHKGTSQLLPPPSP